MQEKKLNKKKAQGAETKKKLYEIAVRLFYERDFATVSVEDITDAAGITKGAFYVHFESKDALIAVIIAEHAAHTDTDYRAFLEGLPPHMTASKVLLAFTEKIADVLENTIGLDNIKKVYSLLLAGTAGTESVHNYGRELYALVGSILEKGIDCGEIKSSLAADILAQHYVAALRGIIFEWCIRYPDFDLKSKSTEHIKLMIDGIKT